MENVTSEVIALHDEEILQEIHDTVEAEEALLESKMTDAEKEKMSSLQTPFIQSLMAEADARLNPNQDKNRVSKVKDSKEFSAFKDEMHQKYIVPAMVKNNGAMN